MNQEPKNAYFWVTLFGIKRYKLLDLETKRVFISRNVMSYEDNFPYKSSNISENSNTTKPLQPDPISTDFHTHIPPTTTFNEMEATKLETNHINSHSLHERDCYPTRSSFLDSQEQEPEPSNSTINSHHLPQRSSITKKTPACLEDYICQQASFPPSQKLDEQKGLTVLSGAFPLNATLSYHRLSNKRKAFVTSISSHTKPNIYQ